MHLLNTLPQTLEEADALEVLEIDAHTDHGITDDNLAAVLLYCPNLADARLRGVPDLSDRTLALLGAETDDLVALDITRCTHLSPTGLRALVARASRLQVLRVRGVYALTDDALVNALRGLGHLAELDARELPLLTARAIREVWSTAPALRTLRLSGCPNVGPTGFPAPRKWAPRDEGIVDGLPPLVLPRHHTMHNLRVLSLRELPQLTDSAVVGLLQHVPRLLELELGGCARLTDEIVPALREQESLEVLDLSFLDTLTDGALFALARSLQRLTEINVSHCTQLTDLALLELAALPRLRRLFMNGLPHATDGALHELAANAPRLTHLNFSGCNRVSLGALHLLLRAAPRLVRLGASVPAVVRRPGVARFSEPPPPGWDEKLQGVYRAFRGANVHALCAFLDKEDARRREAERRCIPFVPRGDDSVDLY